MKELLLGNVPCSWGTLEYQDDQASRFHSTAC